MSIRLSLFIALCACLLGTLPLAAREIVTGLPDVLVLEGVPCVALRPLAELTGAELTQTGPTATVTRGGKSFTCTVGKSTAVANAQTVNLSMPAFIFANAFYAPIKPLTEALGLTLGADEKTKTTTVTVPDHNPLMMRTVNYPDDCADVVNGLCELYLVNLDGSGLRRLTYEISMKNHAAITPDGAVIFYQRNMDLLRRTPENPLPALVAIDPPPADKRICLTLLSCPDGSLLDSEFVQDKPAAETQPIFHINANGTGKFLLKGFMPSVSADGKVIAYTMITDDNATQVHVADVDGGNDRMIAEKGMLTHLSPDGTLIAFTRQIATDANPHSRIFIVRLNDKKYFKREAGTDTGGDETLARFSPDGKQVVYQNGGICIMDADLTHIKQLTKNPVDTLPYFTPDGSHIVFANREGVSIMKTDGSEMKPLTPGLFPVSYSFTPDGKQLLLCARPEFPVKAPSFRDPNVKQTFQAPTAEETEAAKKAGTVKATIKTTLGDISLELYGAQAPVTVASFVKLAKAGFYENLTFHRVVPDFVIQGGDPNGDGSGGPGYTIPLEVSKDLIHEVGTLAMARAQDVNSGGSQFYITLSQNASVKNLDGKYTVFGKVTAGMDVVNKVKQGMRIVNVIIE